MIVIEDDDRPGFRNWDTEYWAKCRDCAWTSEYTRWPGNARQLGAEHVCPAPKGAVTR